MRHEFVMRDQVGFSCPNMVVQAAEEEEEDMNNDSDIKNVVC